MLTEPAMLSERFRRIRVGLLIGDALQRPSRLVYVPKLRLQRIDDESPAHQIQEAAAEGLAELRHLMLRVEADHGLSCLQKIDRQQLQEIAFALAGTAENEHVRVGLIRRPSVQIDDDVAAESVAPDIEAVGIELAGIAERV